MVWILQANIYSNSLLLNDCQRMKPLLFLLGTLIYNRRIFNNYRFLLKSQYWDHSTLQTYQLAQLKELLNHAYTNSKYYRTKYDSMSFHPDHITSLTDLHNIPPITKEELLINKDKVQIRNYPEDMCFAETSTGKTVPSLRR